MNHELRYGKFTSSKIGALMSTAKDGNSFGRPALNYIKEKQMEIRLGRCLNDDTSGRATSWGKLVELRVFELLGTDYSLCSQETIQHPEIQYWAGSPDGIRHNQEGDAVIDIKCPATLKSFCQFADCPTIEEIAFGDNCHPSGEDYYWQLISNAVLTGCDKAELIIYMPFKGELEIIRGMANNYDGDQNKFAWINWASDEDLPYLIEGRHYKNLYKFDFTVSQEHKNKLLNRIIEAGKLL